MKKLILTYVGVFVIFAMSAQTEVHWTLDPLNISGPDEALLGTASDDPLYLVTNNQKRITIDTAGNLKFNKYAGDGTRLLFIDGNGNLSARGPANDPPGVTVPSHPCQNDATPWYEGGNAIGTTGYNTAGTCNNYDFILKSNNNNGIWIKPSTKVGIGASAPLAKLEVLESTALGSNGGDNMLLTSVRANVTDDIKNNIWVMRDYNATSGWQGVYFHDGISYNSTAHDPGVDTRTWWQRHAYNDTQEWGTSGSTYMMLKPNQLIIDPMINGPSSSAFCVNVNGGSAIEVYDAQSLKLNFKVKANGYVYAREINVMPNQIVFPDYVFEKNYKLRSIAELEKFVKVEKHLPNIPAASEVSRDGMNLADMQVKQMEKIEEAFLYIIELKKENDALKARLQKLENSNNK